jgi:NAD+ kinase
MLAGVPTICVFTHRDPAVVASSIGPLLEAADASGVTLVAPPEEADKHPRLADAAARAGDDWHSVALQCDAAIVLAGDGTLLRVLQTLRGGPPVLGVNFGIVGYLSAVTSDQLEHAVERLARGQFEVVELPALSTTVDGVEVHALNDVVVSGGATGGIIEVKWRIVMPGAEHERIDRMGVIPCDGMVLATPVGSTAYNLSNGGPVMAWGVDGYVVSFIAPHTLAARPLVVAPGHDVELEHMGRGAPLRVFADGHAVGVLGPGDGLRVGFGSGRARLALLDDVSFYARYRDNFAAQIQSFDRSHVQMPASSEIRPKAGSDR